MHLGATDTGQQRGEQIDFLAGELLLRSALLVRLLVRQVRDTDISRTEGEVLVILSGGPRRITELAELEGIAQPTMTVLVKRLEANGWVRRRRLAGDARVALIAITDAGSAALGRFRRQFQLAMRSDLEGLPDEQLSALTAATAALGSFVDVLQNRI